MCKVHGLLTILNIDSTSFLNSSTTDSLFVQPTQTLETNYSNPEISGTSGKGLFTSVPEPVSNTDSAESDSLTLSQIVDSSPISLQNVHYVTKVVSVCDKFDGIITKTTTITYPALSCGSGSVQPESTIVLTYIERPSQKSSPSIVVPATEVLKSIPTVPGPASDEMVATDSEASSTGSDSHSQSDNPDNNAVTTTVTIPVAGASGASHISSVLTISHASSLSSVPEATLSTLSSTTTTVTIPESKSLDQTYEAITLTVTMTETRPFPKTAKSNSYFSSNRVTNSSRPIDSDAGSSVTKSDLDTSTPKESTHSTSSPLPTSDVQKPSTTSSSAQASSSNSSLSPSPSSTNPSSSTTSTLSSTPATPSTSSKVSSTTSPVSSTAAPPLTTASSTTFHSSSGGPISPPIVTERTTTTASPNFVTRIKSVTSIETVVVTVCISGECEVTSVPNMIPKTSPISSPQPALTDVITAAATATVTANVSAAIGATAEATATATATAIVTASLNGVTIVVTATANVTAKARAGATATATATAIADATATVNANGSAYIVASAVATASASQAANAYAEASANASATVVASSMASARATASANASAHNSADNAAAHAATSSAVNHASESMASNAPSATMTSIKPIETTTVVCHSGSCTTSTTSYLPEVSDVIVFYFDEPDPVPFTTTFSDSFQQVNIPTVSEAVLDNKRRTSVPATSTSSVATPETTPTQGSDGFSSYSTEKQAAESSSVQETKLFKAVNATHLPASIEVFDLVARSAEETPTLSNIQESPDSIESVEPSSKVTLESRSSTLSNNADSVTAKAVSNPATSHSSVSFSSADTTLAQTTSFKQSSNETAIIDISQVALAPRFGIGMGVVLAAAVAFML